MANKVLSIILMVILFVIFFEIGIFSSYTIVTSEVPDIQGLVDMQISKIEEMVGSDSVNNVLIKDPTNISISNKKDVALKIEELSNVDGVNVDSMNITTYDDTDNKNFTANIEAFGYSSPNSTSGQIIISQDPSYKLIAKGQVSHKGSGLKVDVNTLTINSILKLY